MLPNQVSAFILIFKIFHKQELRQHEPNIRISNEAHIDRAKHMLHMEIQHDDRQDVPRIPRSARANEPPSMTKPLMNATVKEGQTVKLVLLLFLINYSDDKDIDWFFKFIQGHQLNCQSVSTFIQKQVKNALWLLLISLQ